MCVNTRVVENMLKTQIGRAYAAGLSNPREHFIGMHTMKVDLKYKRPLVNSVSWYNDRLYYPNHTVLHPHLI